jgi:hypothetical protein
MDIPPNIELFPNAQAYIKAYAEWLTRHAGDYDVIVTIERKVVPPLAMRNSIYVIETREIR